MPRFVVEGNVTFTVGVEVEVEADDAEEAKEKALRAGLLEEAAKEHRVILRWIKRVNDAVERVMEIGEE